MAASSGNVRRGAIERIRYELEPMVILQIFFPVIMLVVFLVMPVAATFLAARYFDLGQLSSAQYWNPWDPTGKGIEIRRLRVGGETITRIIIAGKNYGIILNSLLNAVIVTVVASILGTIVAFVLARYEFPGKKIVRVLAIVPLLVTPFVNAYVIRKVFGFTFQPGGNTISWFLQEVLHLPVDVVVKDLAGVALAQIITFYPIVYLNMFSAFLNIDPNLEEQAENLGARGFKLFRTVTLPLALPGLAAGSTLVFIFSLEDVGAPVAFNFKYMMSYKILEYFQGVEAGGESPVVGMMAVLMLSIALVAFVGIRQYVSLRQYVMLSKGGRWKPRISRPGWKGLLVIYLVVVPLILFTIIPQVGVVVLSLSTRWGSTPLPEGFTLSHFRDIFERPGVFRGILNSLAYSLSAVTIIVLIAVSVSYVTSRLKLRFLTALDTMSTMPMAIPGLVVAYGYFMFFTKVLDIRILDPTVDPLLPIILAYSVRRLPFAARSIFAGFSQVHPSLDEAAMNLGASRARTLATILIPMLLLNIASGTLLSFVYCMGETSVSVTLGMLGGEPTSADHRSPIVGVIYDFISNPRANSPQLAAALGVLLMALQVTTIIIITLVFKQTYAFLGV